MVNYLFAPVSNRYSWSFGFQFEKFYNTFNYYQSFPEPNPKTNNRPTRTLFNGEMQVATRPATEPETRARNKVAYLHGETAVYTRMFGCKLHCKSCPVIWPRRGEVFTGPGEGGTKWRSEGRQRMKPRPGFMEREMIYGTIVENKSHGSKDV